MAEEKKKALDEDKIPLAEQSMEETEQTEQTEQTPDPWERVPISTPRASDRGDPNIQIGINGVNYVIPMGARNVMVPRCVAEEYERSERAKDAFARNAAAIAKAQAENAGVK